ncbi:uncharacterized protein PG986_000044 [Apiospora aurea]|uniref:Uncharacterized protein n=1 Tax=Apiospora aurea TaxID=335848 RepID=A0ABR1QSX2_9PEZI
MDWKVFYGESTLVNSVLNLPLRGNPPRHKELPGLRTFLRCLIFSQWAITVASAAKKDWNALGISFWVLFCILARTFAFSAKESTRSWLQHSSGIRLERFETDLSSRRALLNTVMALNPDTFAIDSTTGKEEHSALYSGALLWIDPILKPGPDRTKWEEATRMSLAEDLLKRHASGGTNSMVSEVACHSRGVSSTTVVDGLGNGPSSGADSWKTLYGDQYWARFITEGTEMASTIRRHANLSERFTKNGA